MKVDALASLSWKHWIGIGFLAVQLTAIFHARVSPERFFCWAPYDEHTRYRVSVTIDGRPLEAEEITARYQYDGDGWEVRSIHNVISFVKQYEETYGRPDNALVTIQYTVNARSSSVWQWPPQ